MDSLLRVHYSALPEFFGLMPLIAIMENYEADEELKKICKWTMASLAQSLTLPEYIPAALQAIHQVVSILQCTFVLIIWIIKFKVICLLMTYLHIYVVNINVSRSSVRHPQES